MKTILATAALLATAIAAPASAVTLVANFNAADTAVGSVTKSNISLNLVTSAVRFTVAPGTLTNLSQTTAPSNATSITRTALGLGISGGADGNQMDTNQVGTGPNPLREAFLLTGSDAFRLTNLTLTRVDSDDTLQIYGVNANGSLVSFAFGTGNNPLNDNAARMAGAISGGAGGSLLNLVYAPVVNGGPNPNTGTASFGTGIVQRFQRYLITTRVGGDVNYLGAPGQGFSLSNLTATVPEPATWGMMIVGFGFVGVAARRRSNAVAA